MTVHYRIAGTVKDYFSIGKKGPTIRHGSSVPLAALGQDGDLYVCRSEPPALFLKSNGDWLPLTKRTVAQRLPGGTESTISGGAHIVFVTAPNGLENETILHLPEGREGKVITIKDESSDAGVKPIHLTSPDEIDGQAVYVVEGEYACIEMMFSGGSWRIVAR